MKLQVGDIIKLKNGTICKIEDIIEVVNKWYKLDLKDKGGHWVFLRVDTLAPAFTYHKGVYEFSEKLKKEDYPECFL